MSIAHRATAVHTGAEAAADLSLQLRESYAVNEKKHSEFVRLVTRIEPVDLLEWLAAQTVISKFYMRSRDSALEIAALTLPRFGLRVPTISPTQLWDAGEREDRPAATVRAYNSFTFLGEERFSDNSNGGFPQQRSYILPDIELVRSGEETWLTCNLQHTGDWDMLLAGLSDIEWELHPSPCPRLIERTEVQSRLEWAIAVNRAVAAIQRNELQKVVLARQLRCRFNHPLSPWGLLRRLRDTSIGSYLFGLDRTPHDSFISATPERLYRRAGYRLETEAIAGTRPRGNSAEEDQRFRDDLLRTGKDQVEHQLVVRGIVESLQPFIQQLHVDAQPSIVRLDKVQHLAIRISGELRRGVTDADLLAALQPTPAVGGYPRQKAVDMIHTLESFNRGPYAGPIGWISREGAEFAVGIRSAVLREDSMMLYAGAGIVEGSDPDAEWDETDQKFSTFASVLNAS